MQVANHQAIYIANPVRKCKSTQGHCLQGRYDIFIHVFVCVCVCLQSLFMYIVPVI